MPPDMAPLIRDLEAETDLLLAVVSPLDEAGWTRPTPAAGWSVQDQVTHLAYFDEAAVLAATDPETFKAGRKALVDDIDGFTESVARRGREMSGAEALGWFQRARRELVATFGAIDPTLRLPWYGPDMAPASSITARIMETWAHGQDVLDAFGVDRTASPGLRHVAHLGVRTMGFSFGVRGRPAPATQVRVELGGTDGDVWEWGPPEAADRVTGPALDFALVVTQRRHLSDTALEVSGPVAIEWMSIAQAFAGTAGTGRPPRRQADG